MWIIDTLYLLESIKLQIKDHEICLDIITTKPNPYDLNNNNVCCVFIYTLHNDLGWILTVDHNEGLKLNIEHIKRVIKQAKVCFVNDTKSILHYLPIDNLCEVITPIDIDLTSHHKSLEGIGIEKINKYISLSKHYEFSKNKCKEILKQKYNLQTQFFNCKGNLVFYHMEKNGINIDKDQFEKYFYKTNEDKIFCNYNLKTLTSRPTNNNMGVNFMGLNKTNGVRSCFIPKNDYFMELDIKAYHPNLISQLIEYKYEGEDIYNHLCSLMGVDINIGKVSILKQLYGGIDKKYIDIPFFQKVNDFTGNLFDKFKIQGYLEIPGSKHIVDIKDTTNINGPKLLSYLLQGLETYNNINIMENIIEILKNYNTQLVLYVYDSFLIDWDKNEREVIIDIYNEIPFDVKLRVGTNYNNMKSLDF